MTFEHYSDRVSNQDCIELFNMGAASRDAEIAELKNQPVVPTGDGPKTWWELALHVGAWKDHELDYVHFGSEMAVRAFAIHLLRQRDEYEAKLKQERDQLRERVRVLETQLLANNPLLDEAADKIDQLRKDVEMLRGYLVSIRQKAKSRDAHWVECTTDEALAATEPR